MRTYHSASGSSAEDLFIELFSDTFGAEKAGYIANKTLRKVYKKVGFVAR